MTHRLAVMAFFLMLVPLTAPAQSLGSVAKKERARRAENKTKGSQVREFSETEIFGEPEESSPTPDDAAEGPVGADEAPGETSSSISEAEVSDGAGADGDPVDELERQAQQRRRDETTWRARFADARREVEQSRAYRKSLDDLHLTQGEKYVDERGETVIQDLAHLRELIQQADQRVSDAARALTELEEQARRQAIPPGWRR